jgi:hypothetical protein
MKYVLDAVVKVQSVFDHRAREKRPLVEPVLLSPLGTIFGSRRSGYVTAVKDACRS